MNEGDGFNGSSGVFTAPSPGVYSFMISGVGSSSQPKTWTYPKFIYMINDKQFTQKRVQSDDAGQGNSENWITSQQTQIMALKSGDRISVVLAAMMDKKSTMDVVPSPLSLIAYPAFSGTLLYPSNK